MNAKSTKIRANLSCLLSGATQKHLDKQISADSLETFRRELAVAPMARGTQWSELKTSLQLMKASSR